MINFAKAVYEKRKKITDYLLKIPTNILFKLNIHPNAITFLSGLSIIISALLIHYFEFIKAIAFLLLSMVFDLLDGSLARRYKFNNRGFVIDSLSDHCFASLLIISLYSINLISFELMVAAVASIFFLIIQYIYQQLLFKKKIYLITLSISIITALSLIFNQLSSLLIILMAGINLFNGIILFKESCSH